MSTTTAQDRRIEYLASEYEGDLRVTPGTGRDRDRVTVACPDGRSVVILGNGEVFADSGRPARERPFYPDRDVLLVDQGADNWVFVPPAGSALQPVAYLDHEAALELAETVRAWRWRTTGDPEVALWEMAEGLTRPRGPLYRTPDGWEA